jgi:hypothetical protein
MNKKSTIVPSLAILLVGTVLAGCGRDTEAPPQRESMPPAGEMGMGGMHEDTAMMHRHGQEMDEMAATMRQHMQSMQEMQPEHMHERMDEHASTIDRMNTMMDRQMQERQMGRGMDHDAMGRMMGISAEEHQQMVDEMRTLHSEAEQLRAASPDEVRQRMPGHMDRMQRMLQMMERSATHMQNR